MSILASAGRAKIYNTDGTGRDTYVSKTSGGFTIMNIPASAMRGGTVGPTTKAVSTQHIARGGGQGSPGKTIHYHTNGTGRDSYIHSNQGGFANNYSYQNDRDAYVNSLRGYQTTVQQEQRILQANAKKGAIHTGKDHFVAGQISVRHPKDRNGLNMLKVSQDFQSQRLAQPKKQSAERFADLEKRESNFMRTSQQFAMFSNMRKKALGSPQPLPTKIMGSQSVASKDMMRSHRSGSFSQMMVVKPSRASPPSKQPLQLIEKSDILGRQEAFGYSESRNREGTNDEILGRHRRNHTYQPEI